YYIYEAGGIAHLAPDHEKLIRLGTDEIKKEIEALKLKNKNPDQESFYHAALLSADALALFGERYAACAEVLAEKEEDAMRSLELHDIAAVCHHVPRGGARTFHEALQSLFFLHVAIFQESMGETVCPGRIDQILYPYYKKDREAHLITRKRAKELLESFCIKLCETIPVYSQAITNLAGGMPSWQVVTMGGQDQEGNDATNELSYLLLEIATELRMRQPNFHARIHSGSPPEFKKAIYTALAEGSNTPALFNDDVIIPAMTSAGYDIRDARDYVAIGCVEPTAPGKTLGSTDAAILNIPLAVELALNQGKRFGSRRREGVNTLPVAKMKAMDDVTTAFIIQLDYLIGRLISDLKAIEHAHALYRPLPLTSLFIEGCLSSGLCATQGGARYNFSGIQGVGISTAGDSLCAIEKLVFEERKLSLKRLRDLLAARETDPYWFTLMQKAPKFGNNNDEADFWTKFVVDEYARLIRDAGKNTRGGQYLPGIYSNTAHAHFGKMTGALPCGRLRGVTFPSGMAPQNGMDRSGPTALINSMNKIDYKEIANGINFNLKLDANSVRDEKGRHFLNALLDVYFRRGGMQVQLNVLDAGVLREAKEHPEKYPFLLVRI
ncbi:MAG TPA: pyruvate formate lyase family protein, partial [Smithella sp.]|nr:pyruvate formate lyase family protein [Smithella sp.]